MIATAHKTFTTSRSNTKHVPTLLATHKTFTKDGSSFADPTLYRSLVGALRCLIITRPDLSYDVNQASKYLHAPIDVHFQSIKRIIRYIKDTISLGLTFRRTHTNSILGYSDADGAWGLEFILLDFQETTHCFLIYPWVRVLSYDQYNN